MMKPYAAQRITPSKTKVAPKVPGLRDVKDIKVAKLLKPAVLKPAQPVSSYKGVAKLPQYNFSKVSGNRLVDVKPLKPSGIGKYTFEPASSKQ